MLRSSVETSTGLKKVENEDRFICIDELPYLPDDVTWRSLYGVFDGHGGSRAAEFVQKNVVSCLTCSLHYGTDSVKALSDTIEKLEALFKIEAKAPHAAGFRYVDGTTALLVLIERNGTEQFITIANLGDCRAVIGSNQKGGIHIEKLTIDHQARNKAEQERIYANGGYVTKNNSKGFQKKPQHSFWTTLMEKFDDRPNRVYPGGLICTRSIGDFDAKTSNIVSSIPDVTKRPLSASDKFICIASDGLWEKMTDKAMKKRIPKTETDPNMFSSLFAQKLVDRAREMGTLDDITVLLVNLAN